MEDKYEQLIEHYTNYLDKIFVTQVPHHGSKSSWKSDILRDIKQSEIWALTAGILNRYGHPNQDIIRDIICEKRLPYWANECNNVLIDGKIEW